MIIISKAEMVMPEINMIKVGMGGRQNHRMWLSRAEIKLTSSQALVTKEEIAVLTVGGHAGKTTDLSNHLTMD